MDPTGKKRFRPRFGEAPTDKIKTLADEQLEKILQKQLNKNTTLSTELDRPKKFTEGIVVKDESSERAGSKSLSEYQSLSQREAEISKLREHGLTENEITIKLESPQLNKATSGIEYDALQYKLKKIHEKIQKHKGKLNAPDKYASTKSVKRLELEIDSAAGSRNAQQFSHLISQETKDYPENDPVVATLREYEQNAKKSRLESKSTNVSESEEDEDCEENEGVKDFVGPLLSNINERVEAVPKELIFKNRISLNEIHQLDRFKNYKAGAPSKTLYIKNLAKGIEVKDLARLFCRYYKEGLSDVEYKLMTGRMRGQAFVTFKVMETAMDALLLCNGFKLKGKPMIIEYGKS